MGFFRRACLFHILAGICSTPAFTALDVGYLLWHLLVWLADTAVDRQVLPCRYAAADDGGGHPPDLDSGTGVVEACRGARIGAVQDMEQEGVLAGIQAQIDL